MNRGQGKENGMKNIKGRIKPIMIAALIFAVLITVSAVYGDSSILNPGTSRITAGSSFDFTLNTGALDTGDSEAEEALNEYVVNLSISPSAELSVKENVGTLNAVTGTYQVTSSELGGISVLHFTVTPSEDIETDTTYTVSVDITGSAQASDSFSFIATAVKSSDSDGTDGEQGQDGGKDSDGGSDKSDAEKPDGKKSDGKKADGNTPDGNGGMPGAGGDEKRGSMPGGSSQSASTSASSSSVTYAGSWDNYLDSLSVSGYKFTNKFNTTRDTYFISISKSVTSLTVNAVPSDSSAIVRVTGNNDIPEGRSKIMISVTADDGSVRVYRIYVDRG